MPSSEQLADLFPDRAMRMEKSGHAVMSCTVTTSGTLTACAVVSEEPAGYGFGGATLSAARRFRMRPKTVDGRPVGGAKITIPMTWNVPSGG